MLRKDLGELPISWDNYDQMLQLYQAYEGLVAGLIAVARTDGGADPDQAARDRLTVLDGLGALEAHFIGIGLDGATGARRWLHAVGALIAAGEVPDDAEEGTR